MVNLLQPVIRMDTYTFSTPPVAMIPPSLSTMKASPRLPTVDSATITGISLPAQAPMETSTSIPLNAFPISAGRDITIIVEYVPLAQSLPAVLRAQAQPLAQPAFKGFTFQDHLASPAHQRVAEPANLSVNAWNAYKGFILITQPIPVCDAIYLAA